MFISRYFDMGKIIVTYGINEAMKEIADLRQRSIYPYSGMRSRIGEI